MVWECASAHGIMGNLHICEDTVDARRHIQVFEHRMLPSRKPFFQGRPCSFQEDKAKLHTWPLQHNVLNLLLWEVLKSRFYTSCLHSQTHTHTWESPQIDMRQQALCTADGQTDTSSCFDSIRKSVAAALPAGVELIEAFSQKNSTEPLHPFHTHTYINTRRHTQIACGVLGFATAGRKHLQYLRRRKSLLIKTGVEIIHTIRL